jgi:transcriptional repressor NrdR
MRATVHHRGNRGLGRGQAQRRHGALQSREGHQGRQVDEDALNLLAQQVEDTVRAAGSPEVPSHEVGLAILGPLRDLDEVAYLRFASVYRSFSSADDFEREIEDLRKHRKVSTPS